MQFCSHYLGFLLLASDFNYKDTLFFVPADQALHGAAFKETKCIYPNLKSVPLISAFLEETVLSILLLTMKSESFLQFTKVHAEFNM